MSGAVWVSKALSDTTLLKAMSHSFSNTPERMNLAISCKNRNEAGEPLDPACFPEAVWLKSDAGKQDAVLPDIFFAGSFWIVSGKVADVIRRFDLGRGALYPVRVLQKDRITAFRGECFCINFGNAKTSFLPEHSKSVRKFVAGMWTTRAVFADDDLACSSEALSGADLWIDPRLSGALFMSDELAEALKESRAKGFGDLRRCRVVTA